MISKFRGKGAGPLQGAKDGGPALVSRRTEPGPSPEFDELDAFEEDGPLDLEEQLERALDLAFPPRSTRG